MKRVVLVLSIGAALVFAGLAAFCVGVGAWWAAYISSLMAVAAVGFPMLPNDEPKLRVRDIVPYISDSANPRRARLGVGLVNGAYMAVAVGVFVRLVTRLAS